jgi:hypothetical protein
MRDWMLLDWIVAGLALLWLVAMGLIFKSAKSRVE